MRVYVPMTMSGLRRLHAEGGLQAPTSGSAVTPYLREYYARADDEELEYLILGAVAMDSLRLLTANPTEERRRVVVAIEVAEAAAAFDADAGPTAVRVSVDVALRDVVAAHVDGDDAEAAVTAATSAFDGAPDVDSSADLIEALEEHELLWYGAQEIADLV